MKKIFTKEIIIGASVLLSLLILFFGIDYLKGINIFKSANYYFASYTNVAGLAQSAPVTLNGYKIGLLSDFPPEQKGAIWGVKDMCDVVLGSEEAGALKPDSTPFLRLAKEFNLPPEQILYVGNNHKYDIQGAHNIGMKTAWLILPHEGLFGKKSKIADFTFWHYDQISEWFFGNKKDNNSDLKSD